MDSLYRRIVALVVLLDLFHLVKLEQNNGPYDPCCSYPCENSGICRAPTMDAYVCDCTKTGYYGKNCETPFFSTSIRNKLKPSKDSLHYFLTHFSWLWSIINNISFLSDSLMRLILKVRTANVYEPSPYNGIYDYPSWESYMNKSVYVRTLPSIPQNCPTPMGVKGKKELPDPKYLVERFFKRRKFIPCPKRTSVLFPFFAQHFTHQFFRTDPGKRLPFQVGHQALDLSHIYGLDNERQHKLRSHVDGKMKVSIINGEVFPPNAKDADVEMSGIEHIPEKYRFAMGHSGFTMQPTLIFFSTVWLREHNRVCDILKEENPSYDDERLFQTARLILTGETLKVVVEDYVQHLSGYNFQLTYKPELLHDNGFSYNNQIALEFQLLYRWHSLMPDRLNTHDGNLTVRDLIYNPGPFVEGGMEKWVETSTKQFAGRVANGKNQGASTLEVAEMAIKDSRRLRVQPMNNYRKRFGLKPYKTFSEFIDDPKMAKELEELYGDVDAMEYFPGIMLEKRKAPLMFGQTLVEMGSPYSLKGIYANTIGHPQWWKPSTFGGNRGLDIVKSASLEKLICDNVKGCPKASFVVPEGINYVATSQKAVTDDDTAELVMKENWKSEYDVNPKDALKWEINQERKMEL